MNLLLILSAILSALTGAGGASRAVAAPVIAARALADSRHEVSAVRSDERPQGELHGPLALLIDRTAFLLVRLVAPHQDEPRE